MNGSLPRSLALLASYVLVGCADKAEVQAPPPLPALPSLVAVPAEAEPIATYAGESRALRQAKPAKSKPHSQPAAAPAPTRQAQTAAPHGASAAGARPTASAAPSPVAPAVASVAAPAAVAPAPPVAAARTTTVIVPRTPHVHVDFPLGLQSDLDADPRMQAWVDKVIAIVDGCHAKNRSATGAISTRVTMHENDRPDADILTLPGALSSVVACATGSLMRIKMPLFTGREGTRYDVRISFE